jgi:hypothetical protein
MTRPPRRGSAAGVWGGEEEGGSASADGHHVEAKVPGRETGGSSRTTGVEKKCGALAAGERGVTVTVTGSS